jgi:phage-related protein
LNKETYKLPLQMKKVREVIAYRNYFEDFLRGQPVKIQDKIFKVIEIIESYEKIPTQYFKYIRGTPGLFEARIKLGSNIWRVFCFFDEGKLVILLNGFQKKTQKTPKKEIAQASRLMSEYYVEKQKEDKK